MCTKFEKKILIRFELSRPQGNFYGGGGATDLNPIYPRLSSGDIIIKTDPGLNTHTRESTCGPEQCSLSSRMNVR